MSNTTTTTITTEASAQDRLEFLVRQRANLGPDAVPNEVLRAAAEAAAKPAAASAGSVARDASPGNIMQALRKAFGAPQIVKLEETPEHPAIRVRIASPKVDDVIELLADADRLAAQLGATDNPLGGITELKGLFVKCLSFPDKDGPTDDKGKEAWLGNLEATEAFDLFEAFQRVFNLEALMDRKAEVAGNA